MLRGSVEMLKNIHRALPPRLRAAIPADLELWLRRRLVEISRGAPSGKVRRRESMLWGGYSGPALQDLRALLADPVTGPGPAASAALALARWHAVAGEHDVALDLVREMRARKPRAARDPNQFLREALLLCLLGRAPEARALLDARPAPARYDMSLHLMRANAWNPAAGAPEPRPEAEARVLAEINAAFRASSLAPVAKRDANLPLSLDNLAPTAAPTGQSDPKVSVIVPAHDAAATLPTALRSLAAQTHGNIEVLVVDDASSDGTADVAANFARDDPRFRLIRADRNGGAYAARNIGLAQATGDFIANHNSDDWSHPEKIARHLDDLARRDVPFNVSAWARTSPDLVFTGTWRAGARLEERNLSSVFVRREAMERAGPWDTARVSADRELVNRLQRIWNLPRQAPFMACPLAFGRREAGQATGAGATHVATMFHGVRREYHEAGDFWHSGFDPAVLRARGLGATPPYFPAPRAIRADKVAAAPHDLLFIGDFNFLGGTQKSALNMIRAARAAGLDAALLQYRRADQDLTRPLNADVRRLARDNDVRIVAPGETLEARTVVVTYPPVLQEALDRFPNVSHDHLIVVVNQMAERDLAGGDIAYDPALVRANLGRLLGSEGIWAPISERVRALMAADPRYPAPIAETWTPLLDLDEWCARTPRWRGGDGGAPVIGRHGRDHLLKWPRDRDALRAAYCADRPCETRFLGGAVHARSRVGRWPRNWRDEAFGARDVREFLADLDFFAHYPDRDYIEEFGRAPMEAMAVGVPVILPPEFEPTFGPAALYAEPDDVWPLVETLWSDRAAWEARVAAGRAFVRTHCGYGAFSARLARTIAVAGHAS